MKKLLIVANVRSGHAILKNHLADMTDCFVKAGYAVEVRTTQSPGDAEHYVASRGSQFARVVSCGGDGTANEVLNGLMRIDEKHRPELAVVPTGTVNDYAYSLGVPSVPAKAYNIAASGRPSLIDIGGFGDERYFAYVAAFGMFTRVTYETSQATKNLLGRVAYLLEGTKELLPIKKYHTKVTFDDGVIEDDFIVGLFTNAISVAGIRTAFHKAKLDDGLLEITLIKEPKTLADIQSIVNILLDIESPSDIKRDFLRVITTSSVTIESEEPIAWSLDGESGGETTAVTIRNHHKSVMVIKGNCLDV